MMNSQEAQEAQTIADAREHKERRGCVDYHIIERDMWNLLEIVDSQAQKIAEQAQEIERMKDCMFHHMDSDTYNHCQEYSEKMRGKNEKAN